LTEKKVKNKKSVFKMLMKNLKFLKSRFLKIAFKNVSLKSLTEKIWIFKN